MSSKAVRGERGTCQNEIRDRAEHVPPTSLHHTIDRRWVTPRGFERATKHFRAERFYIVIRNFGLPHPRTLFIHCISIFGRVADDVSYCCSSEYCVDNVAQWYRTFLELRACQPEGLASPSRTCVCLHVCVCHSVLKRCMPLRTLSGSARCSNTLYRCTLKRMQATIFA